MPTPTPTAWIDLGRAEANIRRFHADRTLPVRAHVKAHRLPPLTTLQLAGGAVGIAVQFAREARAHVAAGAEDVVVAWPWVDPWRFAAYADLAHVARVAVHVTAPKSVDGLGAAAVAAGSELGARVQLDDGTGRGVGPDEAVALARRVAGTPGLRLDGVTGYAALASAEEADDAHGRATRMAATLVEVAEAIRAGGLACPTVCVGGTPTAAVAESVPGVTEICAGAYALLDAGLAELGWCDLDDVAISMAGPVSDDLLERCSQPWAPDVVSRARAGELVPGHTCPLMPRLDRVTVRSADPVAGGDWAVHCDVDRAPEQRGSGAPA